ncbi:MAG: TonB-dependent receptor, partial [Bacteroidaceae bacterium]|nr:TonB-dependent receptor [Bacteroidaceae bacterium]
MFAGICCTAVLGPGGTASAQGLDCSTELKEVQVVTSRRLKDTGIEKTVIDTTALRENVAHSMADILTHHSTLFIKSYGRATESTAEFRGTSPTHTQVTWNGMTINSPMLGTLDFSTIPSHLIDEVNLYHGASSLHVTGGALGGAVEMTTQPVTTAGIHGSYTQGVGCFGTFDQALRLTYLKGRWATSTRVIYATSSNRYPYTNYDKKTDVYDEKGQVIDSYHPRETNKSGYFSDLHALQEVYYDAGKGNRLSLHAWYTRSRRGLPFLSVDYKDDADFKNEQLSDVLRAVFSWKKSGEAWTMDTRAGYLYSDLAYDYYTTLQSVVSQSITKSRTHTHTAYASTTADFFFGDKWLLTAGLSAHYNHVRSRDLTPFFVGENYNRGRIDADAHLKVHWRPTPRLSLSALVRQEVHGCRVAIPIPAFFADVILYQPLGLVLKASVARNYRYPTMNDLYHQPGGNPALLPEKGFTYDAGVEMAIRRERWLLKGGVTGFDSYIDDWILWTPNVKGYWEPSNVKRVHNYGIEANAHAEVVLARRTKLTVGGNFAWTPSINLGEMQNSNDRSYGKQLCYVPRISANAHARLEWRSWALAVQWSHYGERYTTTSNESTDITGKLKPYYMTDCSLEKSFRIKRVEL